MAQIFVPFASRKDHVLVNPSSFRPPASTSVVRSRMSQQATHNTAPEMVVRRELHRRGLRFRVNYRPVPGIRRTADIAFTRAMVLVLVDGCFWHSCPEHATAPKSNRTWWIEKLAANRERDQETNRLWASHGWQVIRCWEHEDPDQVADRIELAVRAEARPGLSPR